jgi:hypothetical protein
MLPEPYGSPHPDDVPEPPLMPEDQQYTSALPPHHVWMDLKTVITHEGDKTYELVISRCVRCGTWWRRRKETETEHQEPS